MEKTKPRWIAIIIALLVFTGAGLSRISFNVDILKLLPTHLPQVKGLSLFLKHFSQPKELIVTVEAPTSELAESTADALADAFSKHPDLVQRAVARAPWEKRPADLSELLAFLVLNQPPEKIRALVNSLSPEQADATLKSSVEKLGESISPQEVALLSYDPYNVAGALGDLGSFAGTAQQSEFSSADGTFRVLYVVSAHNFPNYKAAIAWVNQIKQIAHATVTDSAIHLGFTGEPAFVADISGSMEWDMTSSGFVTLLVIALIFYLCYRRARPLMELQAMLVLIFTLSLAAAGLFLSQLTVIGVGCAAIMIGLSVDYGYFVYQRSLHHRGTVGELQRQCVQNIAWTSGTTAAVFFALNFSSLPGLSQLGNLVGIGVVFGAIVMLTIYARLTMRFHRSQEGRPPSIIERLFVTPGFWRKGAILTAVIVFFLLGVLAVKGLPQPDFSARTLRPRKSEAYVALDRLYARLTDDRDMLSLVVAGKDEAEVLKRLRLAENSLSAAEARGEVKSFRTALPLWPAVGNQRANLPLLAPLAKEIPRLRERAVAAGFKDEAFVLDEAIFQQWAAWANVPTPLWPTNDTSRWIFRRVASHEGDQLLALGMVTPMPGHEDALTAAVQSEGTWLVSWNQLGRELRHVIPCEFGHVIMALSAIVILLLIIAFRSIRAVALFVLTTALVLACLAGAMSLLGMGWNFFNLAALLLLLGTGTDYSILLLLAMKRNGGDAPAAQRELGLVICLCAFSASAGFGTISWANHIGLASLGQTCALGLVLDALISLFLLPRVWAWIHPHARAVEEMPR
ncbi:exporter-like protein [Chthoniobacter flavus Ellin428]|uniref:Exporter-like protein n=1 Tax=Chthoniobacter flavus Ellin428 TaxID=497964 RepID=B4CW92_9BACT|nr:MMPL family transporter [Chthoniobacter flavus]EDY21684.1 exporter-like protein [Chthoniobacter flavus Ellin428]TCO95622.1 putative exporter [Chthoniobacter flavus]